jgi:hypothetical protein
MSLADLDRWNPDAIHEVFAALTDNSDATRLTSSGLGRIIDAVPWEGEAYDAARAVNTSIQRDLNLQADLTLAVARAAQAAEAEVRAIKADWAYLKQEAADCGMTIDIDTGQVSWVESSDPDVAEIQRQNARLLAAAIENLLKRANQADSDLAAAIDGAQGKESADDINEGLSDHWITNSLDAERDVHRALSSDPDNIDAARRVNGVLDSISAAQRAGATVTPIQSAVLSQLQAQQHGMSVDALNKAALRLGDEGRMLANSWQLMSDKDVNFSRTPLVPGATDVPGDRLRGGGEQLPVSIQHTLDTSRIPTGSDGRAVAAGRRNAEAVSTIAGLARGGNPLLQDGTDLDRKLLDWSAASMHSPVQEPMYSGALGEENYHDDYLDYQDDRKTAIAAVFNAAGRDHVAVHDLLVAGSDGADGQRFLQDLHGLSLSGDQAKSTHALLGWIGTDATSSDVKVAQNAGESAFALAKNLDANHDLLLDAPGPQWGGVGTYNSELVQAEANALMPFQRAMIGDFSGTHGFGFLGHPDDGDFSAARNVFAVIDTDHEAATRFLAAADKTILDYQDAFAAAAGVDPDFSEHNEQYKAMGRAASLLGIANSAAEMEAKARGLNGDSLTAYLGDLRKTAVDVLLSTTNLDKVPGLGATLGTAFAGTHSDDPPDLQAQPWNVKQGLDMANYRTLLALHPQPGDAVSPAFFNADGTLKGPGEIPRALRDTYSSQLRIYLDREGVGLGMIDGALDAFNDQYNHGAGIDIHGSRQDGEK